MKEFAIYTGMRLLIFVAVYAVLAGLWTMVAGQEGLLLVPLLLAVVVSAVLSIRLLRRQREDLAAVVQARAERMSKRYDEMKSKEDVD